MKESILDVLLCDCGSPACCVTDVKFAAYRHQKGFKINPAMFVKLVILDGQCCLYGVRGNLVERHIASVFIAVDRMPFKKID